MYEYEGKYITLMLCSDCNNKCKHCYVKYNGNFTEEILNELVPTLSEKYSLILNGTEPILHPEYYPFFKFSEGGTILTNGLELIRKPELSKILKEHGIQNIHLSYHFGIHDEISLVKTDELNNLIKRLKEEGFTIKLMTSICKDNCNDIISFCKQAHELGVDKIKFTNFIFQGNASSNYQHNILLNQDEIDSVLKQIEEARSLFDEDELYIQRCGSFGPSKDKAKFECFAVHNNVVVTPDGNVYMCVFDVDKGNEIGKLIDGKIMIYDEYKHISDGYCKVLRKYNKL
jgi:MoaA/NifB/PqqE/SkfB family radical SAM enzyme